MTANHHAEIYCALTIVWLLGVTAFFVRWLIRRRRFSRSLRDAQIITSGREFDALRDVRSWLFVKCEIGLVISSQVREPGVWRVFHPVIVLPEGIAGRLGDKEIEAVIMHELVHVLHRDNLTGTLQMIVCSLLWFHPLAWLIDRRLLAEREMWCDETVIRLSGEPKLYANSLWKVAQIGLGWPVAGVSRAAGSNLKRRLERMMKSNGQWEMTNSRRAAAYASFFALAFLFVLVGLPGAPAFAQRNEIEATDKKELSQGVKGGVEGRILGGVSGGVSGGVIGSMKRNTSVGGATAGLEGGVAGGAGGRVEGAKTLPPDGEGQKWELIEQAPEFLVKTENWNNSPVQIMDARVKVMGWEFQNETRLSVQGNEKLKVMASSGHNLWNPLR
jgi:beta-lactamase regulating signal transducer with metallopeptidase domain